MPETTPCPLCETFAGTMIHSLPDYFLCACCDLRFLHPSRHLNPEQEKQRYDLHQNRPDDPAYVRFLEPIFTAVIEKTGKGTSGLDFGSGPSPVLANMLRNAGRTMATYDPYFCFDPAALSAHYDFVVTCETAEHFYSPGVEFGRLFALLSPGGWLGVQTQFVEPSVDFANWYYRRDPTHVVFYSRRTFTWIAAQFGFVELTYYGSSIVLMQRPF